MGAQGISQLSGPLWLANAVTVWFLIACAIGFPFWLVFAWFFEFTPQGFKRESEVAIDAPQRHSNARKLEFTIIGVIAVAIVLLLTKQLILRRHETLREFAGAAGTPAALKPAAFNPPAGTLVVLPFANLSGDKSQQYFSDGITEELTNALGQNTGLRVIAWDTASHYRDSTQPATTIGKALNVAYVLTGKILRQGNAVRVIVELVNARSGYQVWANHYDDALPNVFQVQDKISASIAEAVKAFGLAQSKTELAKALIAAGRLTYQSLLDPKLRAQALVAVEALRQRTDLDPYSVTDVIQLYLALGEIKTALELLPQNCAATPVACNDLSVNPAWIPLRGQPRFQALVKQCNIVSQPAPAAAATSS